MIIAAAATALLLLLCGVAQAAERVPLMGTTPARAQAFDGFVRRPDGAFLALTLYADSNGTQPPTAPAEGAPFVMWALVSQNWRAGASMLWVRATNSAGVGPMSNCVVVLAGIPDTLWHLERAGHAPRPVGNVTWKHAMGRVGFSLVPGDSTVVATIVHQEVVQQRERARICAIFGQWALRGALWGCP